MCLYGFAQFGKRLKYTCKRGHCLMSLLSSDICRHILNLVHVMAAEISSHHSVVMVWNSRTDFHLLAPPVKWQESNWNCKPELPFNNNTFASRVPSQPPEWSRPLTLTGEQHDSPLSLQATLYWGSIFP